MSMYILAIDEGTTGVTVQIFDAQARVVSGAYREFLQYFPKPGWVEHDAAQIWQVTQKNISEALEKGKIKPHHIAAIGITNQRETFLLWDRKTGKPHGRAIVWQCRRSSDYCDKIKPLEPWIQRKTGLRLDPYFSLTKLKLLLDSSSTLKKGVKKGELLFGTMDSWLLWNLTGKKVHATDWTNASRTMMLHLKSRRWDQEILKEFQIPEACLPELYPSRALFGMTQGLKILPDGIPITGIAGDQQAALFGQGCVRSGMAKNTYGTGCFLLMHTGKKIVHSKKGLITTLAATASGEPAYALEGSIFIAGAAVQWLRDGLGFFKHSAESEQMARQVKDSGGVMLVPAFVGLGAPYWRSDVRGAFLGLTRGTTKEHLVRATLESIAFQTRDIFDLIQKESGMRIKELQVDGKVSRNQFLMQFQSNLLEVPVHRPKNIDTTVKGAALLAGFGCGFWQKKKEEKMKIFKPIQTKKAQASYQDWQKAVQLLCSA